MILEIMMGQREKEGKKTPQNFADQVGLFKSS